MIPITKSENPCITRIPTPKLAMTMKMISKSISYHNMDMCRIQKIQNPSIMSYHQQRILWGENPINSIGNIPERINIQPGVNLIQNSQIRPQNRKLQDFIALAFTATKPFIHIPIEKIRLHINKLKLLHQVRKTLHRKTITNITCNINNQPHNNI